MHEAYLANEDDVEDAQVFYKAYARRKGFAIRTNHTRLSKDDKTLCAVDYVCTREGFRRASRKEQDRTILEPAETKIGCKAIMRIKKDGEKWIVNKFVVGHNHILLTPKSTSFLRGHRGVSKVQKNLIMTLNESGVPTRKIMSVLSKESGGDFNIGCIGKDVENYVGNKRRKVFEEGDAQRLYSYFVDRQLKEPEFVFSMQVDKNGAAYQYFGDVVTFDATYLTNIYKMSFVPFSGVNHHHQTIMFAMFGRAPSTIITNDDKVMAKATGEVLLNTIHRLCLWHILQKFLEHLAHAYNKYPDFQKDFHHYIHETITTEEFEQEWALILWVPAYLRSIFCAGMSTTQKSESMNKFFKDYVKSSTMVSDFVHQYEKSIDARYFKEKENDVRTKSTRAIMKTPLKIEEEATMVYTRNKKIIKEGETKTYGVNAYGKETPLYHVTLEGDEEHATCTCHKWDFMEILCRRILCVFGKKMKLDRLP
ncbi:hypothetical protein I3760_04G033700 [Carya illinoinensis]|nr:hypothetical protein I3760_04G033700 [Carya illinoinensis]